MLIEYLVLPIGLWCWIIESAKVERFFYYYFPLAFVLVMNVILVILIQRYFRYSTTVSSAQYLLVTSRVKMYLGIFAFVRIWSILDRVADVFSPEPIFALALLHALFSPMQGFANAIVYGLNGVVVNSWKTRCRCCRRSQGNGGFDADGIGEDGGNNRNDGHELQDVTGAIGGDLPPYVDASSMRAP